MATKGFTLIELLVVISIIGILASLAMVSYSGAQKQTRDTQRRSDLGQYRNALESYAASNNGVYPVAGAGAITSICGTGKALEKFIASCPADPIGGTYEYRYESDSSGLKYRMWVNGGLETGGTWVVCYNGKTGKTDNNWSAVTTFCPF